jgi:isopentenyl diphosphate isomerase/L-lactate dehydrogenase-like FMN-dependent dehydrogenase
MSNGRFETVAVAQRRARRQLPKSVYWSIVAGSEQGATLKDNVAAFGAVMIGRAYLWGLAANGQAGVENVLDLLRGGIDSALLGLGKASVGDLTPDDIVVPPGFTGTLGGDGPIFDPAPNGQAATG